MPIYQKIMEIDETYNVLKKVQYDIEKSNELTEKAIGHIEIIISLEQDIEI